MVQDGRGGSRSLSPPERTAARAARTRTFEAILHDQNRFSYFLDYLSVHAQAHKLLFWFEIEQFKLLAGDDREMASHQETIFEKYFGLGARGGAMGLELPQYAVEHTEVLYSKAKRRPIGYMFDVAQAFVYQELRDRWLPQFRSSVSHTAMLDQMRVSYPVSLPQLLAEGPFNYCLNNFIYDLEECPTDLRVNYQIWLAIQSVLRPLCSSALQKLDQRGITWASKDLSSLEKEGIRFMETYVDGPNVVASILDEDVKFLIGKRVMGLTQCKPGGRDGILGVGAGSGKGGASYAETLKATVSVLNDALLAGQEQAYRALEAGVIPALTKSNTFGNFVDDLSALECAPLQARLRLLNDWADVQRKLPEKAVESTAGGRTSHLLRPCPTPVAPDVWPIASSKAGGVFGGDGRGGKDGRGRVVRAGGGADVTCPSLLFVFQVDTEETTVLLDTEDSVVHGGGGGGGGGISGHTPRGLHGCAALVSPLKTTSRRVDPSGKRYSGPGSMRRRESARPPPSMGAGNPGMGGGSTGVFSSSFPSPKGKMLRRFRTKVRQLRHVVAARVLQDTPSGKTGGGTPSVPEGEAIPKELDLLAGMASDDTDYRKVRSRLNGQILELIAADVTEWLPRYCLPSAIARVETKKKNREHKEASPKGYKEDGNPQEASPSGDVKDDFPAQQPRVHHFVMTVPRKRSSPPASPGLAGHPSGGSKGRRERGNAPGGPSGRPGVSGRTSPRRWGTRPVKGSFPLAIDRESNLVLHAACATVWRKLERREEEEDTSTEKKYRGKRGGNKELVETTAYVPRCVCALSFDPLFDTLRAVALARGGFPEAGRALMLDGVGGGAGDRSPAGGGGTAKAGGLEGVTVQWGLGDAATLQAAPPPLPIISAPPAPPAPTLPTIFAPATRLVLPLSGRGVVGAGVGTAAGGGGGLPSRAPPLVLAVSAPESTGGWSVESEGDSSVWSVGTVEMGAKTAAREAAKVAAREAGGGKRSGLESDRWSSFGLPPLVPLDHPVEPLFQALSSDNVLLSLSALLCERPVVVTCSVRSLLSVAVSSLKTLLHPLGWHHAYAPLLPATEVMGFWKSKMLLDKRSALSQGRSGSPPRITPQQWGSTAARAAEAAAGGTGSTTRGWDSPERSWRQQTPFLVGLEGELVRMACGKPRGVFGNGGGESRKSGGGGDTGTGTGSGAAVWGVVSSESCMMPPGTQGDAMGVATTQPRSTLLEVVRLMLRQSVHVDLDHDEVTWPPPAPPSPLPDDGDVSSVSRRTISSSGRKWGGGSRAGVFFEDSGERASSQSGGKGGEGAPPGWPEEAARQAKRVIQFTLFPEFEDFDAVSPTPPERVEDRAEDDSALFKCSRSAGGGPEVSLKKKIEAIRNMSSFDKSKERNGVGSGIGGLGFGGMGMGMGMRRGMASKMTESVVGMYVPTQADLALRAAAAGLVASVLGRVKEFTTLFAQAGLLRFDTAGFVAAVASDSRNTLAAARGSKTGVNNNNLGSPGLGGGVGSATASSGAGSSPARVAGVAVAGQDDDGSPVVVESTAEDGESAEGAGGEGRPTVDVSGTEMCLQVVRTRAFAALLSDEVFSDVDLEALQAELKLHSVQIRDFLTASQ